MAPIVIGATCSGSRVVAWLAPRALVVLLAGAAAPAFAALAGPASPPSPPPRCSAAGAAATPPAVEGEWRVQARSSPPTAPRAPRRAPRCGATGPRWPAPRPAASGCASGSPAARGDRPLHAPRFRRRAQGHRGHALALRGRPPGRRPLVERFSVSRAVTRAGRRLAANLSGRARITGTCGGAPAQLVVDWTAERTDLPERPTAGFTLGPDPVSLTLDGGVVEFADTSADDLDGGEIVAWSWDFGDGTTGEGRTVTHRYASVGTFRVKLTVTDDDGLTASVADVVTVEP